MGLMVGYDTASLDPKRLGECGTPELKAMAERAIAEYSGPVTLDRYGRRVPKRLQGRLVWTTIRHPPRAYAMRLTNCSAESSIIGCWYVD